ncbi:MAG TPA: PVC-type heme-binding CxxCH protein, partial [Candidatus Acidoferrum sp.]|nr:PVC-type heme-binding CxxCH protein [Candidatus Acidoferrum sp.]
MKRIVFASAFCLVSACLSIAADLVPHNDLGLRLQRGFTVELAADADTAPDTYCMTFDARGRLVVANGQSIRTLEDTDGDGLADTATVFANLGRGAMGMCFDGPTLYVLGDQALLRFEDVNGDGVADGPPQKILTFGFGEHGAHAIRKGPDGYWYIVGGNDTGFNVQNVTSPDSPIRRVEAGAMLRLAPDLRTSECIAHGFRNPYDFDFGYMGDIFTYDSDTERDAFLPWYLPTRLYHVGFAQHHGWRLPGHMRSWPRPEYYPDTAETMAHVGRGSPTGVTVYRHTQFPPAYRDGLFFCDWTFGRVFFAPLTIDGASYANVTPEVFIEPMGMQGFAPTDVAVSPDGALYVSIGGRKTRGAVYRIDYAGLSAGPSSVGPLYLRLRHPDLHTVLSSPQPLDAWSRTVWYPIAERLGALAFAQVAIDETISPAIRVRAVEVLTEVFGGLPTPRVPVLAQAIPPIVRARVAWSLGRAPEINAYNALLNLALDPAPIVRRAALDALIDQPMLLDPPDYARVVSANLSHADRRIRLAAARLASLAPDDCWEEVAASTARGTPMVQVGGLLAEMWRTSETTVFPQLASRLTNVLAQARDVATRTEAVRLMILAIGDWHLIDPSVEVFTAYEPAAPLPPEFALFSRQARAGFPSGNAALDTETARLLAMFQDDDPRTARAIASLLTDNSAPSQDFHYLACLARLRAPLTEFAPRIARTILSLNRKLGGQEMRVKQNWDARLSELVQQFTRREPAIAEAMLRDPLFVAPAHVELAAAFSGERRVTAARRFLTAVRTTRNFTWTPSLVELIAELPRDEVFPLFRLMVNNPGLREMIVLKLATAPANADRATFLGSLGSMQPQVVRASLESLLKLPPDPGGTNLVMPLRLLRRVVNEPQEKLLRAQSVALISSSLKQPFNITEPSGGEIEALKAAYQPVFNFVNAKYPALIRIVNADEGEDPTQWDALIRSAPWDRGVAARGERAYIDRGCAACHSGGGSIGPDLAGSVQRMSREDMMAAIAFPSRDIAPAYRSVNFRLRDGQMVSGIVAFESADGWLL